MNKKKSKTFSRTSWIVFGFVLIIMASIGIKFYLGYQDLKEMDDKIAGLKEDIGELKEKKKKLKAEIDRVDSQEFIENEAREKLGMVKEGETLYITVEEKKQEDE